MKHPKSLYAFLSLFAATAAHGSPVTVAGFVFSEGEVAFADDAFLVSGDVRSNCVATGGTAASSVAQALSGSDVTQCVNSTSTTGGIVEVVFTNNSIGNAAGVDLIIFELSGPQAPGTPDPREQFGVSIFDGATFSPFVIFTPVATGVNSGPDPTLDVFAVQIDLSAFGLLAGARTNRVQLHIFDVGLGTKSGDIAALGALHSVAPIPEPASGTLILSGFAGLGWKARRVRSREH